MRTDWFDYEFRFAGRTDTGKMRSENQDEVILAPGEGLFAVSDGMGGVACGGQSSKYVQEAMPLMVKGYVHGTNGEKEEIGGRLSDSIRMMSERLFAQGNSAGWIQYGATAAGFVFHRDSAVFFCLGDSRGYILPRYGRELVQVTEDMNVAGLMVRGGEMTKEEAKGSPASSQLTAFVGMAGRAVPETYVVPVRPGDRLLVCSDGLYGMVPEPEIAAIMRSGRRESQVVERLIARANEAGGKDNISAVYVRITKEEKGSRARRQG